MSNSAFAFRRDTAIPPYEFPITTSGQALQPVAVDKLVLNDRGCETFRISNPAKCWVWLRGWNGSPSVMTAYSDIANKGHLFGPGCIEILRTQFPDWIAVVAADFPDAPALSGRSCFIAYGGGL